ADQFAVDARVYQVAGGSHLGTRSPIGEIAAGIGRRSVKLQRGQGKIVQLAHGSSILAPSNAPACQPATGSVECINSLKCLANTARRIGRAPNELRWAVSCWQSMRGTSRWRSKATRWTSATF